MVEDNKTAEEVVLISKTGAVAGGCSLDAGGGGGAAVEAKEKEDEEEEADEGGTSITTLEDGGGLTVLDVGGGGGGSSVLLGGGGRGSLVVVGGGGGGRVDGSSVVSGGGASVVGETDSEVLEGSSVDVGISVEKVVATSGGSTGLLPLPFFPPGPFPRPGPLLSLPPSSSDESWVSSSGTTASCLGASHRCLGSARPRRACMAVGSMLAPSPSRRQAAPAKQLSRSLANVQRMNQQNISRQLW